MLTTLRAWDTERDGSILAATVMPDHVHVLFELGHKLTVGQCVARWKSAVRRAVNFTAEWQRDFWEHRLRPDESAEDYALYIFLNPYRARLIPTSETWPWLWRSDPSFFAFTSLLDPDGTPPSAWLDWPADRFSHLSTGE
jgi:putative transposase